MIFVILGTQKFQMNRLLRQIDCLIAEGAISAPVIAQIGHSDYEPVSFEFHRFLNKDEFDRYITQADMIVTHGGVSSIITALKLRKPVIVYPRLAKFGEHVDNHQCEIARAFAKKGYVLYCGEDDDLAEMLELCKGMEFTEYVSQTENITRIVNDFLDG